MNGATYRKIEEHMLACMGDAAHDKEHVYRVLYNAIEIAASERDVDYDVLISACLLHDIGRIEQLRDPSLCHAQAGGDMAHEFLLGIGWDADKAAHVKDCIASHRFRKNAPPKSLEAKILFDADKIDVTGAIGIARTLVYDGILDRPLYTLENGVPSDGDGDARPSFLQEYCFKLKNIYDGFLTKRGKEIAEERRAAAQNFYAGLFDEVKQSYAYGKDALRELINE